MGLRELTQRLDEETIRELAADMADVINGRMREIVENSCPGEEFADADLPLLVAGLRKDRADGPS